MAFLTARARACTVRAAQHMRAGKCCCASTRVFPAASGEAEHALSAAAEEAAEPGEQSRAAAGVAERPGADIYPVSRREGRAGPGAGCRLGYKIMSEQKT